MATFGITPVGGFPQADPDEFPRFIQFQENGVNVGDTTVQIVNFVGNVLLSVSSDGLTLTVDVSPS